MVFSVASDEKHAVIPDWVLDNACLQVSFTSSLNSQPQDFSAKVHHYSAIMQLLRLLERSRYDKISMNPLRSQSWPVFC